MTKLAATTRQTILEVEDLKVAFPGGREKVVRGISFMLKRGECLALIGESGCGKSVTLKSLVGLNEPTAVVDAVRFDFNGQDIRRFGARAWRQIRGGRIGFILQDALGSLDPLRPVGKEIAEPLRIHSDLARAARRDKVIELLKSVGVPEPELRALQYPHQLSGGLRQRALIASAIACHPELLLADEPTTALDALVQAQVLDLLATYRARDTAMLIVSHDLAVAARLADRVAVMQGGRIVEQGLIDDVFRNPQHPYTRSLIAAAATVHAVSPPAQSSPNIRVNASTDPHVPEIETQGVSKSFVGVDGKHRTVVSNASLVLHPGRTLGIVGGSGSGKTTLSRIVLGLETPDSGTVLLRGRDWRSLSPNERGAARRRVQVVFQDPLSSFDPRYTVEKVIGEALAVAGYARGAQRRNRAVKLLELVRLDESHLGRRPIELSGGQRQRVAIARALAPNPAVIVCDEPVSALDVSVQAKILELLSDLKEQFNLACLFISHDLGVIRRMSDEILVMNDGAIVESGDAAEIFRNPQHAYTQSLLDAIPPVGTTKHRLLQPA
jgi:peptide/nickel transport system ATP-binding protein